MITKRRAGSALAALFACFATSCTQDFSVFEPGPSGPSDASSPDTSTPTTTCTEPGAKSALGHCYFPVTDVVTFEQARTACAGAKAHLVTIGSSAEQTEVASMRRGEDRWIGLSRPKGAAGNDPNSFTWITSEPVTYRNWAQNEPNNGGECARMQAAGTWGDQACTTAFIAICERD